MSVIRKKYSYNHIHDATSMAYILKEQAGADELRAMKLAPAPSLSKTNAVGRYRSILRSANDSWSEAESSYADLSSYDYKKDGFDSSQEECLRVADRHHHVKNQSGKSSRSSKKSSDGSSSDSSSEEERKPKKKSVEVVATCKHCKKYGKTQHPERLLVDQCMWRKKAVCFRYASVCRKMGLEYVKGDKFEKG